MATLAELQGSVAGLEASVGAVQVKIDELKAGQVPGAATEAELEEVKVRLDQAKAALDAAVA